MALSEYLSFITVLSFIFAVYLVVKGLINGDRWLVFFGVLCPTTFHIIISFILIFLRWELKNLQREADSLVQRAETIQVLINFALDYFRQRGLFALRQQDLEMIKVLVSIKIDAAKVIRRYEEYKAISTATERLQAEARRRHRRLEGRGFHIGFNRMIFDFEF